MIFVEGNPSVTTRKKLQLFIQVLCLQCSEARISGCIMFSPLETGSQLDYKFSKNNATASQYVQNQWTLAASTLYILHPKNLTQFFPPIFITKKLRTTWKVVQSYPSNHGWTLTFTKHDESLPNQDGFPETIHCRGT